MHHLINFKNFSDAQIELLNPVTLLIGRNGAGKSNVIEGVELLAELAQGRSLHEISDVGRGGGSTFEIRGGLRNCPRREHASYDSISELTDPGQLTLKFTAHVKGLPVEYLIIVAAGNSPHIVEERLIWGERTLFATAGRVSRESDDIIQVRFDNFAKGGKKPIRALTAQVSTLSRYETLPTSDSKMSDQALGVVNGIRNHLKHAYVFDPHPKRMRDYENIGQTQLFRDGANLASVLYGLKLLADTEIPPENLKKNPMVSVVRQHNARASFDLILQRIRQLPEDSFTDFVFEKTSLGEVGLGFRYSDQSVLSSRQMSDGTLRALAILTALETVPSGSRLVVEEIDNGIHPARVKVLMDAVWETAERRKLNVLATTHNPATLDQLSDEQIKSVVLCFHDPAVGASRLLPIPDLPASESMLEQGRLGELMTQQVLEKNVQPGFAEKRAERGLQWLQKIQEANRKFVL
jgi:ABC-type branched-subunit amino acid transport system ATPase component